MTSTNPDAGTAASAAQITVTQLNNGVFRQLDYSFFESRSSPRKRFASLFCGIEHVAIRCRQTLTESTHPPIVQARLKEGMLMMGLTTPAYTLSWFITYFLLYLPAALVAAICLRVSVYQDTSIPLLMIFYVVTLLNMIALCFMVEPFLSSPRSGAMAVTAMLLVVSAGAAVFNTRVWDASSFAKTAASLVSPVAFMYANRVVAHFEGNYDSLAFSNISGGSAWKHCAGSVRERVAERLNVRRLGCFSKTVPIGTCLWQMTFSACPSSGPSSCFPFTRAYWTSGAAQATGWRPHLLGFDASTVVQDDPPADAVVGISINRLGKTFRHPRTRRVQHAVRELSMDACEGQTLALLGKNGSGKSTLVGLPAGLALTTFDLQEPLSRRAIWDTINREKQSRTVIFTTHFMDEAEYLGDRIAILASGQLKATGTTLFLKRTYGVGYSMTVMRSESPKSAREVSKIVRSHLPDATALGAAGDLDGETLLRAGVRNYDLSVTSLEEVFLRIVSQEEEAQAADENTLGSLNWAVGTESELSSTVATTEQSSASASNTFELIDVETPLNSPAPAQATPLN
ncbi:hypothetical protein BDK51DRAFT_43334 [Blyttiomyces helicus]|uniref:ABC transporter domain-containing protein n=1 Tax=Blyttiomyces helicus TaxID=388810 RepID=A0A4P9WMI9_9FUNG|nr:hypothetical protein BDK51DRAFT_43334 [Blyttiomyces helicus]|eukprot:RKO92390.1 hypothetical protein BDK51DRAFT_43334 [Blyttiomyces helicus]